MVVLGSIGFVFGGGLGDFGILVLCVCFCFSCFLLFVFLLLLRLLRLLRLLLRIFVFVFLLIDSYWGGGASEKRFRMFFFVNPLPNSEPHNSDIYYVMRIEKQKAIFRGKKIVVRIY